MVQQKCHFLCVAAEYSLDQWRLKDLTCTTDKEHDDNYIKAFSTKQENLLKPLQLINRFITLLRYQKGVTITSLCIYSNVNDSIGLMEIN